MNGYCPQCKWLDRSREVYWLGMGVTVFVCRKREIEIDARNRRDGGIWPDFPNSNLTTDGKWLNWSCLGKIAPDVEKYLGEFDFSGGK